MLEKRPKLIKLVSNRVENGTIKYLCENVNKTCTRTTPTDMLTRKEEISWVLNPRLRTISN